MATVTKENVGLLHDKLTLTLDKQDYLPAFEKTLKDYSKKANIPGFRKGMVPAGLIKKMYGNSLFTDEVLRSIDRELVKYLENEMINNEIARLQNRYGNMKDEETVSTEENVLNVMFTETDENGNEVPDGIK